MGSSNIPSVASLDRPEKYQDLLKEDRGDDCLPCRVVGEFCWLFYIFFFFFLCFVSHLLLIVSISPHI